MATGTFRLGEGVRILLNDVTHAISLPLMQLSNTA